MKISKFSIAIMMDHENGFSCNGAPPAKIASWSKYVRNVTVGNNQNAVIMGRNTYELFCGKDGYLPNRQTYVISSIYNQENNPNIIVYKSLLSCLCGIAASKNVQDVWIVGGYKLIKHAMEDLMTYCKKIIICKLSDVYDCDLRFPIKLLTEKYCNQYVFNVEQNTADYQIQLYTPKVVHQELQYLNLLNDLLYKSESSINQYSRNRVLYNKILKFSIMHEFPILTARTLDYKSVYMKFLDDINTNFFTEDDLGFNLFCDQVFTKEQTYEKNTIIEDIIKDLEKQDSITVKLKNNYDNLPISISFDTNKKYLNTTIIYGNIELFHDFPNQLIYFGYLIYYISYFLGTIPKDLTFYFVRVYIDKNHTDLCKKMISRDPRPWPNISIKAISMNENELSSDSFSISNYSSWMKLNYKI